jgi:energy-coupling factor transporter ATP-binding protein EcfA2
MEKATKIDDLIKVFSPMPLKTKEELDEFRIDTIEYRTGNIENSPIKNIFETCTFMQSSCILMGHRGCGKSTELNYLSKELEESGYTALSIDTAAESNLLEIDYFDIMLLITEGLLKIAEQKNIPLHESSITSVLNFFKETVTEISIEEEDKKTSGMGVGINIPLVSNVLSIFGNIKKEYKFNTGKRKTIKEVVNRKSSLWLEYITDISNNIIHGLNLKSPVLILEGLDKLEQREDNAFNIFTNRCLLSSLISTGS